MWSVILLFKLEKAFGMLPLTDLWYFLCFTGSCHQENSVYLPLLESQVSSSSSGIRHHATISPTISPSWSSSRSGGTDTDQQSGEPASRSWKAKCLQTIQALPPVNKHIFPHLNCVYKFGVYEIWSRLPRVAQWVADSVSLEQAPHICAKTARTPQKVFEPKLKPVKSIFWALIFIVSYFL